jgi:hypothetical protein
MKTSQTIKINNRTYSVCFCDICNSEFTRRSDYHSFDNCLPCSNIVGGKKITTHGCSQNNNRLYVTWQNMKRRCLNPTPKEKMNYKNISLCEEWQEFTPFMKWSLLNGYREDLTIDRKDNSKGYYPGNCRFADYNMQNANKRITSKNKSGYIGVCSHNESRFRATVNWKGNQIMSEYFDSALDAAKARDKFVISNNLPHVLNF